MVGMELPDHADLLPFGMLFAAGGGWLVGVGLGSIIGKEARPPGAAGRRLLFVGASAVGLGAFVIVSAPVSSGWPAGGARLFSVWGSWPGGTVALFALMVDTAVALTTFWVVSRDHDRNGSGLPGRLVGATGIAGLVLGGAALAVSMWFVALNWSSSLDHQKYRVVYKTTTSLANAASRRLDRTGSFPTNLDEVLSAGGKIQPGARVEFVGVVNGSFCARVGVEDGEERAGDPRYSALVHRRPKGSNSWVSLEIGQRNSCATHEH